MGSCPRPSLTPAIREQIARLGRADIMVGIPSFKNAATIGYVVRAAQAGLVQYFPDLHPVVVNSDAGLARRHRPGRGRDRAARLHRADPARPSDQQARAGQPDLPGDRRGRRQGRGAAHDLRDRGRARGPGAGRRRLGPALDRPRVDRAAGRAHPQGRLRLRRAALRPLQVRRHDHQHRHLPADPGALRPPDPPADRRRLRRVGRPRPALPVARRLDRRHQQVRDRHLDDDARRWPAGSPSARPGSGRRSTIPRTRAPTSGRCSARSSGRSCAWPSGTRSNGCRSAAATTSRPTASSGSSTRRRSR